MTLYARDQDEAVRVDGRKTVYQFDFDRDVPWTELAAPGRHMPVGFLDGAGYQLPPLDPEAAAALDWAFALCVCETFAALEHVILRFTAREQVELPKSRSITLLRDEEEKHIRLFERYAAQLRAARPDHAALFDQTFAAEAAVIHHLDEPGPHPDQSHYIFWLNTLFVEEYTIFIDELLGANPEGVQPVWRAIHAAHRQEESQHVVTDAHFLEAVPIAEPLRRELSELFTINLMRHFDTTIGLGGTLAFMSKILPNVTFRREGPISKTVLFQSILGHRLFKRTRRFAPYLAELG
jgi:hypothetical protein